MNLKDYFERNAEIAVAFSGGVDSAYLLYSAARYAERTAAYYVRSQFQPAFELNDAVRTADQCGAELRVIELDVLACPEVAANPPDRCYHCKRLIMGAVLEAASNDGFSIIADGSNASDDVTDRPGTRALSELGIVSPLRECGITKAEIRELAREAGLDVWDKPAYACLATRTEPGTPVTAEKLKRTEKAEAILFDMGFRDFRVRQRGGAALLQVTGDQYEKALGSKGEIEAALEGMYDRLIIDSDTRREYMEELRDRVCELKCNIDDMTAEEAAFAAERLMSEGAKDVTLEPVVMKKGRPGLVLTLMCADDQSEKERFARLIFRYTSTIGIREIISERYILSRSEGEAATPYGRVRFKKVSGWGAERLKAEYEDLANIARERDCSIADARALVMPYIEKEENETAKA